MSKSRVISERTIAIVGATGAVGRELIALLETRSPAAFPIKAVRAFASPRSVGQTLTIRGKTLRVEALQPGCFDGVDIAFFDASDEVSKQWVPAASRSGAWVIDNSATYRMDPKVPLMVPEVNGREWFSRAGLAKLNKNGRIIAGPNCSTVQLVAALKPIADRFGLKRVIVSSYQSVSGAGTAAMEELRTQSAAYLAGQTTKPDAFAHGIAFNCIPQIGGFGPDGYTSEEQKIMAETRKILALPKLKIAATAVRVPTLLGHGETVVVECSKAASTKAIRAVWSKSPALAVVDDPAQKHYPMGNPGPFSAVEGAGGRDAVYVGRLRQDPSIKNAVHFWVVADNLRKGAALNAIQIGERLVQALA